MEAEKDKTKSSLGMTSSLVGLKAELFEKQEQLKREKLLSGDQKYFKRKGEGSKRKPTAGGEANRGVAERAQRDLDALREEAKNADNARRKLEEKAKLYDQLSTSTAAFEEEVKEKYLTDFEQKVIDKVSSAVESPGLEPVEEEGDWVDYVDSFGRDRRCLREDYEAMQHGKEAVSPAGREEVEQDLLSNDMRREMLRKKWEKEAEESARGPVHYANVRYDEVRDHGTGFYQFSRNEEERAKELEQLKQMTEKTQSTRARKAQLLEKRKAAMKSRLEKVRARKRLRGEQPAAEGSDSSDEDTEVKAPVPEAEEPTVLRKDSVRLWDMGKPGIPKDPSPRRPATVHPADERPTEFAPPSFYYQDNRLGSRAGYAQAKNHPNPKQGTSGWSDKSTLCDDVADSSRHRDGQSQRQSKFGGSAVDNFLASLAPWKSTAAPKQSYTTPDVLNVQPFTTQASIASTSPSSPQLYPRSAEHQSASSTILSSYAAMPLPNMSISPPNMSMPPPNMSVPPPDMSMPPPDISVPVPDMSIPPPNMSMPLLNMVIPPPDMVPSVTMAVPPPNVALPLSSKSLPGPDAAAISPTAVSNITTATLRSNGMATENESEILNSIMLPPDKPCDTLPSSVNGNDKFTMAEESDIADIPLPI